MMNYTVRLAYLFVLTCNMKAKSCRKSTAVTKCVHVAYNA